MKYKHYLDGVHPVGKKTKRFLDLFDRVSEFLAGKLDHMLVIVDPYKNEVHTQEVGDRFYVRKNRRKLYVYDKRFKT